MPNLGTGCGIGKDIRDSYDKSLGREILVKKDRECWVWRPLLGPYSASLLLAVVLFPMRSLIPRIRARGRSSATHPFSPLKVGGGNSFVRFTIQAFGSAAINASPAVARTWQLTPIATWA